MNILVDHHSKKANKKFDITLVTALENSDQDEHGDQTVLKLLLTTLTKVFFMDCNVEGYEDDVNDDITDEDDASINSTACIQKVPTNTENEHKNKEIDVLKTPKNRKRSYSGDEFVVKRARIALTSPVSNALKNSISYSNISFNFPVTVCCSAKYAVWQGRRKARRAIVQSEKNDIFKLEEAVSKLLLSDSNNSDLSDNLFSFKIFISVDSKQNLTLSFCYVPFATFSTEPNERSYKAFCVFFHHFEVFLPMFVKKCLKPSNSS